MGRDYKMMSENKTTFILTGSQWVKRVLLGRESELGGKSQSQLKKEGLMEFLLGQTGACWERIGR